MACGFALDIMLIERRPNLPFQLSPTQPSKLASRSPLARTSIIASPFSCTQRIIHLWSTVRSMVYLKSMTIHLCILKVQYNFTATGNNITATGLKWMTWSNRSGNAGHPRSIDCSIHSTTIGKCSSLTRQRSSRKRSDSKQVAVLTEPGALQKEQAEVGGHKGVIDDLGRGKDTLCSCPRCECKLTVSAGSHGATHGIDFLLHLLQGFTLHGTDTRREQAADERRPEE
jgi:hypothetical protein